MSRYNRFTAVMLAILFAVSFGVPSFAAPESSAADVYNPIEDLSPVRNQGADNVSYAFVAAALAEIALERGGYDEDISEQYMRYAMSKDGSNTLGFSQAYNAAFANTGDARAAIAAYLTRGEMGGLAVESEDPYAASSGVRASSITASKLPVYRVGDVIFFDDMTAGASDGERAARIELLQQTITDYGAVGGWIYSSQTTTTASASTSYWYDDKTLYKFTASNKTANWCVALVGWDDGYDDGNGAFIVRNSWGASAHGGTDDKSGYFYLSYLDYFLLRSAFAVANPINLGDEYIDATYEHDPFGAASNYDVKGADSSSWAANIFTVTEDNQTAKFVSFAVPDGYTNCEIYLLGGYADDAAAAAALASLGGTAPAASKFVSGAGYYTVGIPETQLGAKGEKFIAAVKMDGKQVPVEEKTSVNQAVSSAGQSFASADGASWSDISGSGMNACIKVLAENGNTVHPTGVTLSSDTLTIRLDDVTAGNTATLAATVTGEGDSVPEQKVIWSSSDPKVAAVSESGLVTAKKAGNCVITARAAVGGKKAECAVWVPNIEVASVTLSKNTLTLKTNEQTSLTAKCLPSNASDLTVKWSVDNDSIATVSSVGVVKALAPGTAVITAESTISAGVLDTCTVTVEQDYVSALKLDKKTVRLSVGSALPIKVTATPETAYDKSVTWTTVPENSDVAVIENDIITAMRPGTVTFIAAVNTPKPGEAAITASVDITVVDGVDVYCTVNRTVKFTSTLTVADASKLVWTVYNVSNGEVASTDDIAITTNRLSCTIAGKTVGEYRIEVKDPDNDGNSQIVRVGVKVPVTKVITYLSGDEEKKKTRRTEITIDQDGGNPGTVQLYTAILPEDATYSDVTWKSSKPNIATVSDTGLVTAVSPGSATITCTTNSDNKRSTFSVNVRYNTTTLTLNNKTDPLLIDKGRSASVRATVDKVRNVSKVIEWSSSDESIASVNKNGRITAISVGTATITARTLGGLEKTFDVNCEILPTRVNTDVKKLQLTPNGDAGKITASILPATATATDLTFESRDETIASVDKEGNVTPGRAGTTTITITTENNKKTRVTVMVK